MRSTMRGSRSLIGLVLAVVAAWLGASIAALVTGAEQDAAIAGGAAVASLVLLGAAWRGRRTARRRETTYW